jgi:hypothetical protein
MSIGFELAANEFRPEREMNSLAVHLPGRNPGAMRAELYSAIEST